MELTERPGVGLPIGEMSRDSRRDFIAKEMRRPTEGFFAGVGSLAVGAAMVLQVVVLGFEEGVDV